MAANIGKSVDLKDGGERVPGTLTAYVDGRPLTDPLGVVWKRGKAKCAAALKWFTRERSRKIVLGIESCIAVPFFLLAWFLCAAYFAVIGGYRMAKADDKDKTKLLEAMPPFGKRKS